MKLKKRLTSLLTVMVMAVSMMSVGASASGTATASPSSGTGTNVNVTYNYSVDGNYDLPNTFTNYCGQKGNMGFIIKNAGTYTITAGCPSWSGVRIEIYRASATPSAPLGTLITSYTIPTVSAWVSSINCYPSLSKGKYYFKFVSTTYSTSKVNSSATIKDVYGTF